ncbi:MAG: plastocyanin/azurin family copper-binding protein [Gaiellales bacterium]
MSRHSVTISAALAIASLGLAAPALAHPAAATPLAGTVGPGFSITLDKGGKKISTLKPGSYAITVSDKASIHDFHLFGPGVNKIITTVAFVGTKSVTVTLRKGTYTYQCDPHAAAGMKATFKVA